MIYRFTTENSIYEIDEDNSVYKRSSRRGDITNIDGHRLEYNVWLPLWKWSLKSWANADGEFVLRIWAPDSVYGIHSSPIINWSVT